MDFLTFPLSPTGRSFYKFPVRVSALAPISKTVGARLKENLLLENPRAQMLPSGESRNVFLGHTRVLQREDPRRAGGLEVQGFDESKKNSQRLESHSYLSFL